MKPKQYIQGWVEFYKLKFTVTPDTLIPRPETELLVDEVLKFVKSFPKTPKSLTILDLGTGSGNIAISLACNIRCCSIKIIAADISKKALKIAGQNAKLHRVENIVAFIQSDLLKNLDLSLIPYHSSLILVTNLPYIPSARIPYLDSSVKNFEPYVALDGGVDGFELYRKLFAQIKEKNWQPKLIAGEIDYTQRELAVNEAQKYFPDARIEVKKDFVQKQRILLITST